jgi:MraZ protein
MTDVEFMGQHTPRLDEKGRLFLPARFREGLGESVVVTKGMDRCLTIYPHAVFKERILNHLNAASSASRNVRQMRRALLANASTETPDRQGRVTIPAVLREFAGLDRECVVIGQGHYVEVWDAPTFAAVDADSDAVLDALDEEGVVLL